MSDLKVESKGQVIIISFPPVVDTNTAAGFVSRIPGWSQSDEKLIILDFGQVTSLDQSLYRPVSVLAQALKKKERFLFTIKLNEALMRQILTSGLDSAFSPKASLEDAMKAAGLGIAKPSLDVRFINPFLKATHTTLEIQANTKITPGKPYLKKDQSPPYEVDIAGVLSMTSNVFNGSIAICFPQKVFLKIYGNMMMMPPAEEITKEIEDAAGEILNIIYGQAKAELNDNNHYHIQKAIPTVVRGSTLKVHHLSRNIAVILPFECEAGPFHLEISSDPI